MSDVNEYIVFAGDKYYPSRALGDMEGSFQDFENAKAYAKSLNKDWYVIVSHSTMTEIDDD